EKVEKKVNTSKNSTIKSSSIVETSLAKDKELDWANKVENNIKAEKVSKLPLFSKGKDNKETYINLTKVNTTQVNTLQVNKIIVTSQVNNATPAQKKSQDKSQTKKWSELFSKFKKGNFSNIASNDIVAALAAKLGQDNLANVVTDAASNNITKETSNSGLTENSDSSEVEEDNNMEEVTFTTPTNNKHQ
ncbi:13449_t:CDS:2, partial [Cetraspora pellucida]